MPNENKSTNEDRFAHQDQRAYSAAVAFSNPRNRRYRNWHWFVHDAVHPLKEKG
jgi:hypothetical protein